MDIAVDVNGKPLPYSPSQVKSLCLDMIDKGQILAVIVDDGKQIGIQVFGEPSREILDALETVTHAYRNALRGQ